MQPSVVTDPRQLYFAALAEIERLRAAGNAAFFAMCDQRDNPDAEVFQDAIDALGLALK